MTSLCASSAVESARYDFIPKGLSQVVVNEPVAQYLELVSKGRLRVEEMFRVTRGHMMQNDLDFDLALASLEDSETEKELRVYSLDALSAQWREFFFKSQRLLLRSKEAP